MFPYSWAGRSHESITEIFLGYFYDWNHHIVKDRAEDLGRVSLKRPIVGEHAFSEDDDDVIIPIAEWLKWYKFGITRTWDNLSLDIRANLITREDAIRRLASIGGGKPPYSTIEKFCEYINISSDQFFEYSERFRSDIVWKHQGGSWIIPGFLIENWKW